MRKYNKGGWYRGLARITERKKKQIIIGRKKKGVGGGKTTTIDEKVNKAEDKKEKKGEACKGEDKRSISSTLTKAKRRWLNTDTTFRNWLATETWPLRQLFVPHGCVWGIYSSDLGFNHSRNPWVWVINSAIFQSMYPLQEAVSALWTEAVMT